MPHPMAKGEEAVQLKTFDPATFYPALAAHEKLKNRDDSVNTFPQKSVYEPTIPKDFDPAVFYPALAAQEKAKVVGREDSVITASVYPSTSTSQSLPKVERPVMHPSRSEELIQHKRMITRRLWIAGSVMAIMTIAIIVIFAYFGAHGWFKRKHHG